MTRGGRFLEAQVIGSKQLAKDGQLVVISAGDKSLHDDCQSCLQAMARHIFYLGLLFCLHRHWIPSVRNPAVTEGRKLSKQTIYHV